MTITTLFTPPKSSNQNYIKELVIHFPQFTSSWGFDLF
jgi:hypothetical protein